MERPECLTGAVCQDAEIPWLTMLFESAANVKGVGTAVEEAAGGRH